MTEEERYGGILANIEKTGEKWNKERIGSFGRAIVANTLLLRAQVNTMSAQVRKNLKEKFRAFMWKGAGKGMVIWEVLLALDAAKIRMLVSLMTKDRQPWMKWVERAGQSSKEMGDTRGNVGKTEQDAAKRAEGRLQ